MIGEERSLSRQLDRERERVDRELETIGEALAGRVPPALREPVAYALSTRGKRLRPILCVAAYRAAGREPVPGVYRLGCALEIVHTYSLVHDDLPSMDDDDLRRGRATVHRVYGDALAMLAGASLLPLAVQVLDREGERLGLTAAGRGRLVTELCAAAGAAGMVGGQLLDLEGERREVDGEGLETIHRAKTGALLTASLRVGAIAAGASDEVLSALTGYGEALGLAFQITDDILDVVGSSEALGKEAGRDEVLKKASYPSLFGLDGARGLARARADEAKAALRGVSSPFLETLADFVVERES